MNGSTDNSATLAASSDLSNVQVEILMATFNGEEFIADQIESIVHQSHQSWRLLVHDDGSTDRTMEIVGQYQKRYPDKVRILNDGIRKGSAMRNFEHLMGASSGRYVMFSDQDDVWLESKIDVALRKMVELERKYTSTTPLLIHTDLEVVDEDLVLISPSMFDYQRLNKNPDFTERLVRNNVTGCTAMANRAAIEASLPIPRDALMHDWWLALEVVRSGGYVCFIDQATIKYRQHGSNSVGTKKVNLLFYASRLASIKQFVGDVLGVYRQVQLVQPMGLFKFIVLKIFRTVRL